MNSRESLSPRPPLYSRREFLGLVSAGLAGTAALSPEVNQTQNRIATAINAFVDINGEWQDAKLSNEKFVEMNAPLLKDCSFSSTFSPEKLFELNINNYKDPQNQEFLDRSFNYLEFLNKDLGIDEVRLGVRWNSIVGENGNFDFGLYEPYFDYCIKEGIDISLNLGIKVYWWPEEHFPKKYSGGNSPPTGATIDMNDRIAEDYIHLADKILDHLSGRYSKKELGRITKVQPGNEIFNPFGRKKWTMANDFTATLVQHIDEVLPGSKILLNSSEFKDLYKIYNLFEVLSNFIDKDRLIAGIDYYPFISGNLDPVLLSRIDSIPNADIIPANFQPAGYANPEITEAQTGPWINELLPQDRLTCIKYVLQRSMTDIVSGKTSIGYWDMEDLLKAPSKDTEGIFDLFRKIKNVRN